MARGNPGRFSLLQRYAILSLVVVILLALGLSRSLERALTERTLEDAERSAGIAAATSVEPFLTPADLLRDFVPLDTDRIAMLDTSLNRATAAEGMVRLKIWNTAHWLVYSDNPALRGRWFPSTDLLNESFEGRYSSEVTDLTAPEEFEDRDFGTLLAVYVPLAVEGDPATATTFLPNASVADNPNATVIGAFEIYLPYEPLAAAITTETWRLRAILAAGLLLLWIVLFQLIANASRGLRVQGSANRHMASHDPVTGLPNRGVFTQEMTSQVSSGRPTAVVLLDLVGFKEINDTLGHETGDRLLQQVAGRLGAQIHRDETLARMGSDEFGLILPGVGTGAAAISRVCDWLEVLDQPFDVNGMAMEISADAGIALSGRPLAANTADVLLQHANIALHQARQDHMPIAIYDPVRDRFSPDRLELVVQLRRAVDRHEFVTYYQPQIDTRTGQVRSLEALVRWQHPDRGLIGPDEFIDAAQHSDLIHGLTHQVLDTALEQCGRWRREGHNLRVSVNLSARDAMDPTLPAIVAAALAGAGVPPEALTLELTESAVLTNFDRAISVLTAIGDLGVEVALDDFGTGYSSLATLRKMPVSELKIDRSIVERVVEGGADADVVQFTVDLGRRLNMRVVAEGTETEADAHALAALGCDILQGFHTSRPISADDMTVWLVEASAAGVGAPRLPVPQLQPPVPDWVVPPPPAPNAVARRRHAQVVADLVRASESRVVTLDGTDQPVR